MRMGPPQLYESFSIFPFKPSLVLWTHMDQLLGSLRASLYFYGSGDNVFCVELCDSGLEPNPTPAPKPSTHEYVEDQ